MTDDHNLSPAELEKRLRERKWEQVQIKGLTAWLNSYLSKYEKPTVATLPDDLKDGVRLLQFLECMVKQNKEKKSAEGEKEEVVFPKYIDPPKSRIQKMENASKALNFITQHFHVKLVGIGAEDVVDGNLRLILGLLWSSFRTLSLGTLSSRLGGKERDSRPEDDLLKWIAGITEGYGVKVENFKTSFNDGMVWAALIDRFDPDYIDFQSLDRNNKEATLNLVFEVAEKKLGIPRLFEPAELIEGNPDERSVILYSSLFYHAWTSNEERIKLANESRGLGSKMSEYKSQLEQQEEERQKLQRERDALKEESNSREKDLANEEDRIKRLEAAIAELQKTKEEIKNGFKRQLEERKKTLSRDVDKLSSKEKDTKKKLKKEKKKSRKAAQENAVLLAEKKELTEKLNKAKAGVAGLADGDSFGNLAGLLREHVAAMHLELRRLEDEEKDEKRKSDINVDHVKATDFVKQSVSEVNSKSEKEAKEHMTELFQGTNNTLVKIFQVKDARNELNEVVDKKGFLMAQVEGKRWKKRWFVLRGFFLYYYNKKEDQDDLAGAEGEISLEHSTVSALNQEGKPSWAIRFAISDKDERTVREELIIGTKTKEERDDWLFLLRGKILYLQYLALLGETNARPDLRVINWFSLRNVGTLNMEGVKLTVPLLKILCDVLCDHEETERIALVDANLDDDGIVHLCKVLEAMPGLLSINFSRNRLTYFGIKSLAQALSKHTSLQEIDLSHNDVDDEGLEFLARLIEKNPDIDSLNLSHNNLSGEDEKHFEGFAKAVGSLKLLTALKFRHNKLHDSAAAALAKVTQAHPAIIEIALGKNNIGDEGAHALFTALHENQCVQKIDLSHNKIGTKGVEALKTLLQTNTTIQSVDFSNSREVVGGPELNGFGELQDIDFSGFAVNRL